MVPREKEVKVAARTHAGEGRIQFPLGRRIFHVHFEIVNLAGEKVFFELGLR